MHDAGGDRSRTVKALGTYIEKMKAKGHTFTTVSGALQQDDDAANGSADGSAAGQRAGAPGGAHGTEARGGTQGAAQGGAAAADGQGTPGTSDAQAAHRTATGATLYEGRARCRPSGSTASP